MLEQETFSYVVEVGRLHDASRQLNPAIPDRLNEEALSNLLRLVSPSLVQANRALTRLIHEGVAVGSPGPMATPPALILGWLTSPRPPLTTG